MQSNLLRDLALAGVKWELTENVASTLNILSNVAASGRTPTQIVPPIAPVMAISPDTARAMASRPTDMESLNRMIAEFNHPLRDSATNTVLPHVAKNPGGLIVITDVPGGDDDMTGNILSGPAGDLFDKMIGAIGMSRENVSILPIIFWRTPGGRTPTREELDFARPFVDRAIEILSPRVILTLGTLPAKEIMNKTLPRDHGVITELENGISVMPIFHPNYLMLKSAAKRDAWTALQSVQKMLKSA